MSEEMKNAYRQLDINDKRNQLSDELLIIFELIKRYENAKGINPITQVKNYDIVNDKNLNEDEILTFFYEDVYNIQQELITLLNVLPIFMPVFFHLYKYIKKIFFVIAITKFLFFNFFKYNKYTEQIRKINPKKASEVKRIC